MFNKPVYLICALSMPKDGFSDAINIMTEAKTHYLVENDDICVSEGIEFEHDDYIYMFSLLCPDIDTLQGLKTKVLDPAKHFGFSGSETDYEDYLTSCNVKFSSHPSFPHEDTWERVFIIENY